MCVYNIIIAYIYSETPQSGILSCAKIITLWYATIVPMIYKSFALSARTVYVPLYSLLYI